LKKKKAKKKATGEINPLARLEEIKRLGIIAMFSDDYLMEKITLKGGNAIDLVHKAPCRASIDLDFSMETEFEEDLAAVKDRIEKALKTTFRAGGYEVFDMNFMVRPRKGKLSPDLAPFWGGYLIEFKLIKSERHTKFSDSYRKLRMNAIEVNLPFDKKKVFKIDISKYEYCIPKQRHELDDYTIYVYTPEMIVIEKLRAICQQMPEYNEIVRSPSRSARAKDFFDIYTMVRYFKIDLGKNQNLKLINNIFNAKKVPITLIGIIGKYREYHRQNFEEVKATIKPTITLRDFDYYFDYVLKLCKKLEILWKK
jgi:hypothetical protein